MPEPSLQPQIQPEFMEIDLRAYLKILQKWRLVIALITISAVAVSGALSYFVLPPVYETQAVLMVANAAPSQQAVRQEDGLQGVVGNLSRLPLLTVNSYVNQVNSPAILSRVIGALKLNEQGYTVASLDKMITVKGIKDTNLIQATVENTDPDLAVSIGNTLSREFLNHISESNQEQMTKSVQFLESQVANVEKELKEAVKKLTAFEAQARGPVFLEQELKAQSDDYTKYKSGLSQSQVELSLLAAGAARLEESLKGVPQTIETTSDGPSPVKRLELNPVWVSLTQALDQKRLALAEKEAQSKALSQQAEALEKQIRELQTELSGKRTELDSLQAAVERLKKTQSLLSEKITETRIARSVNLGETNVIVVSPALKPHVPVKPRKTFNMAIAGVLGLMVSVGLAFVLEHLDNTVKTAEDVQRQLGLPVLGSIPKITGEARRQGQSSRARANPAEAAPVQMAAAGPELPAGSSAASPAAPESKGGGVKSWPDDARKITQAG